MAPLDDQKGVWKQNTKGKGRSTPKGRQVDETSVEEVRVLLGDRPRRRDLLIEHLHLIQDANGHLSARHIAALADEMVKLANPLFLHHPLTADEPQVTFAFPFSPASMDRGPLYEFCLHHVCTLGDPMDAFDLQLDTVRHG